MMHWLKNTYGCEIVAYTANVGGAMERELEGLEQKALATGASQFFAEDLRADFAKDYIFTAIKANATYEDSYLMGTALARPIIAKRQIEIARNVGADAVAHGATGKGNDQIRFELAYHALAPDLGIIAPWKTWELKSRSDLIEYAKTHKIPISASLEKPYSIDANLMHVSFEGGILEDPWQPAPKNLHVWCAPLSDTPPEPREMVLQFKAGVPIAFDGEAMAPHTLIERLNQVAGHHGVGRIDIVENRFIGMKSRGIYETPGVTVLHHAHRALETLVLDREVMRLRDSLATKIADCIYNGFWFSPEFSVLRRLIDDIQSPVEGEVKLQLHSGTVRTLGRRSERSLYCSQLATFERDDDYCQGDAEGFIKLQALRLKQAARVGQIDVIH